MKVTLLVHSINDPIVAVILAEFGEGIDVVRAASWI